jgi:alginate O-acetyltransferase complex protein AlgJ
MTNQSRIRVLEEWLIIGSFVLAISLPGIITKYRTDPAPSFEENRQLAQFPRLSRNLIELRGFPHSFGLYFNDHFAFRRLLIRWQAVARVKWLGTSTTPNVIMGKNGWFFDGVNVGLGERRGPLTRDQIARWRQVLVERNDWLAARGIKYLFVVAPEKDQVYPEYLPETGRAPRVSRQDQLIEAVRDSHVEILDLRPSLIEAKRTHLVYLKTDTHWNSFGAFVAYQTIIKDLSRSFPRLQALADSDITFSPPANASGNLAQLLGLYNSITEQVVAVSAVGLQPIVKGDFGNSNETIESEQQGSGLPRVVMFRDSFVSVMIPFLARHFSRAIYVWQQQPDRRLIETEHPDVVIQEVYEGSIADDPPLDVPGTADQKPANGKAVDRNAPDAGNLPPVFEGAHSLINCAGTMGWAWDKNRPDQSIKVDIYDGYQPLQTIMAGAFQREILDLGIGNGRHVFSYPLPPQLKDGKPHEIRVRFAGTSIDLQGTPLQIKCEAE